MNCTSEIRWKSLNRMLLVLYVTLAVLRGEAGQFTATFEDGSVPAGSLIEGGILNQAIIEDAGGNFTGKVLKLTRANSVARGTGRLVVDDLDSGNPVSSLNLQLRLYIGGAAGVPGRGLTIQVVSPPSGSPSQVNALTVEIRTAKSVVSGGKGIGIYLLWRFADFASVELPLERIRTGDRFVDLNLRVHSDGTLDLEYDGSLLFADLTIPNFRPFIAPRYEFFAATDAAGTDNHWVDDITLATSVGPVSPRFVESPRSHTMVSGAVMRLYSTLNDPGLASGYQWQRRRVADTDFQDIEGATDAFYETPPIATEDDGALYRVAAVLLGNGAREYSESARVKVSSLERPFPVIATYDFDSPEGTPDLNTLFGGALFQSNGGINGSGRLNLQRFTGGSAMVLNGPAFTYALESFNLVFELSLGPGTAFPQHSFSVNWANDLPASVQGVEGSGSGLSVVFDLADDGGGEGPSIDLRWKGALIANRKMRAEEIARNRFETTQIELAFGQVSVMYAGEVVFERIPLPGFAPVAGKKLSFSSTSQTVQVYLDSIITAAQFYSGPLVIVQEPKPFVGLAQDTARFFLGINDPRNSSFRWEIKRLTDPDFVRVSGGVNPELVLSNIGPSEDGALVRCVAIGTENRVTSQAVKLTVINPVTPTDPTAEFSFNTVETPVGTRLTGNAKVTPAGGVADSGVLRLTENFNNQAGAFIIEDLDGGRPVDGFAASFKLRFGGGSTVPADGLSFNWANDIPNLPAGDLEEGVGSGLRVCFDIFDNGNPAGEAPSIDIKWKNSLVASKKIPIGSIRSGNGFKETYIRLSSDGLVDVVFGGALIHAGIPLPGYAPTSGGRFVFAARTGGLNENQWVDDLSIKTFRFQGPVSIVAQPSNRILTPGGTATFSVSLSDASEAQYQWESRRSDEPEFTALLGQTQSQLTLGPVVLTDDGRLFRVRVVSGAQILISDPAALSVREFLVATPKVEFDFEGESIPGGGLLGNATVVTELGVGGGRAIALTRNVNSQLGSFLITNVVTQAGTNPFTVSFDLRMGEGTLPPADGFSFVWGETLPEGAFGETGYGNGLVVSFDSYDNGQGEAPAVDVQFGGIAVGNAYSVPVSFFETRGKFIPIIIHLDSDGTLDVVWDHMVIFDNLALPGFKPVATPVFGFGARTGLLNANHIIDNVVIGPVAAGVPNLEWRVSVQGLELIFTGTLEAASAPGGPYAPVGNASSPYTVPLEGNQRFFRTTIP